MVCPGLKRVIILARKILNAHPDFPHIFVSDSPDSSQRIDLRNAADGVKMNPNVSLLLFLVPSGAQANECMQEARFDLMAAEAGFGIADGDDF
jgi:hypothetical protein